MVVVFFEASVGAMKDREKRSKTITRRGIVKNGVAVVLGIGGVGQVTAQDSDDETIVATTKRKSDTDSGHTEIIEVSVDRDVSVSEVTPPSGIKIDTASSKSTVSLVAYSVKSSHAIFGLNYEWEVNVIWEHTGSEILEIDVWGQNEGTGNNWSYVGPYLEDIDYRRSGGVIKSALCEKWGEYTHPLDWASPWCEVYVNGQGEDQLEDYGGG